MRISTSTLYNENITTMNNLQSQVAKTQQQIATGRRILNPADDPAGAARAVELTQSDSANTQYGVNRTAAMNTLGLAEGVMQSVTSLLQDVRVIAVDAGNGILNDTSRKSLATELQGRLQELLGLANSSDGAGNFLFSGSQGTVQPFVDTAGGVAYQGDDVQRKVQAAASRQITTTDSGADIFMRIRNGNGLFQAAPGAGNTGTGSITQGAVIDPALYNNNSYQIVFTSATTYDINDVTAGPPVPVSSGTYVSGQTIGFNGVQVEIRGAPVAGDTFDITPSTNQSLFTTLSDLIATLNASIPSTNAMNSAAYRQGLNDAFGAIDQGLGNVLNVRATMGARLRELDALQATGEEVGLQLKQTLSKVQDTDYNKAISELAVEQMTLQAAQQSFAKVSQMSLFDYL
ncbi:MAG: flagellar hook-associated protein FlgL [Nitrosomonadales bacterium]|nr:flagellar hook-associated protein FlgL [Nitrosomonadales bacterium]